MKKALLAAAAAIALLGASCSDTKSDNNPADNAFADSIAAKAEAEARAKEAEAAAAKAKADSIKQAEEAAKAEADAKEKAAEIDAVLDELEGLGDSLDAVLAKAAAGDETAAVKAGPMRDSYQVALMAAQALEDSMTDAQRERFNALKSKR